MTDDDRIYIQLKYEASFYRKYLKRWFRYQQNVQSPIRYDHSSYISVLSIIEEFIGITLYEDRSFEESWKLLREGLNKAHLDLLKDLYNRVKRHKAENLSR